MDMWREILLQAKNSHQGQLCSKLNDELASRLFKECSTHVQGPVILCH